MARTAVGQSARAGLQGAVAQQVSPTRWAAPLAASLWIVMLGLSLAELWMIAVTLDRPTPDQWSFRGFEIVLGLSFGSVGALVATRRPGNRVGWLLLSMGVISGIMGIVDQYPVVSDAAREPLPLAELARWISAWIWVLGAAGLASFVPLIFPDGRLLSPRWRAAVLLAMAATGTLIASIIVVISPIGPLRASPMVAIVSERLTFLMWAGLILYLSALAAAAASLVRRYRRARSDERQQIKWVAYAAVLVAVGAVPGMSPILLGQAFFAVTAAFLAVAVGIAILRYRLYEIDVIIKRTLVYGALSAILAGVYTASITLSQRLFMAITGERSDAAIVLTTLIVAATFTPIKTRLQAGVDRRINGRTSAPSEAEATRSSRETFEALDRLIQLYTSGGLTPEEFQAAKARLLERL